MKKISLALCVFVTCGLIGSPVSAGSLTRSVDVKGTPATVWAMIGPWCAVKDWLPMIGVCIEDGKSPPVRTLITKDGKTAIVERQIARDDAHYTYSYKFIATPLPVKNYKSTMKVVAKGKDMSTITWSGSFTADKGKDKVATTTLAGIYESGLNSIKEKLAK